MALAGVAIATLLLLAGGLSQLEFESSNRLVLRGGAPLQGEPGLMFNVAPLWQGLVWAFLALIPISLVAAIIWPKSFLHVLGRTLILVLFTLLVLFALRALRNFIQPLMETFQNLGSEGAASVGSGGEEGVQVSPVDVPRWAAFPFLLGGLAFLALSGWWIRRVWLRGRRRDSLAELSKLAGAAAGDLEAGEDLRSVVIRCYREMSQLLSEGRDVPFPGAMTAREFERQLRRAGVHDSHVPQLSRLFEEVRYGGRESSPQEEREAVECLRAVQRAYGPV